jgi:hypothetical protein
LKARSHEVIAYHTCGEGGYDGAKGDEWKRYDWSKLTTVAQLCDQIQWELVCAAHEHGVRVVNWMQATDQINTCRGLDVLNAMQ